MDVGAASADGVMVAGTSSGGDCSATGGATVCESSDVGALSVGVVGVDKDGVASAGVSGVEDAGGFSLSGVEGALSAVGAAPSVGVSPAQARFCHFHSFKLLCASNRWETSCRVAPGLTTADGVTQPCVKIHLCLYRKCTAVVLQLSRASRSRCVFYIRNATISNYSIVSKEIGSEQIPKSTIAALGKMPGSEGNHGQTAKHRQYCVNVARLGFNSLCGGGTSHIDCKGPVEPLNLTGCTSSFDNKRLPEPPPNCISLRATVSGRDQPVEDASDPAMRTGGRQRLVTQTIRYARSCGQHTAMHSTLGCRRLQLVRYILSYSHIMANCATACGQHRYHAPCNRQAAMSITAQTLDIATILSNVALCNDQINGCKRPTQADVPGSRQAKNSMCKALVYGMTLLE